MGGGRVRYLEMIPESEYTGKQKQKTKNMGTCAGEFSSELTLTILPCN